jgi:Zn finger protein HypA/HybF involved in hydrogenase expression
MAYHALLLTDKIMDVEINNDNPDFKCKECGVGIEVFTEKDYEADLDICCPNCEYTNIVRRELTYTYEVL